MTLTAPEPGTPTEGRPTGAYPPPPWRLRGPGAVIPAPAPLAAARRSLPAGLEVMPVWPGWTLRGLLLARYSPLAAVAGTLDLQMPHAREVAP